MKKPESYTNKEVSVILGVKQSNISYYTNIGVVIPKIANPRGRGNVKRYSVSNIVDFLLIRELSRNGMSLKRINFVLSGLSEDLKNDATCGDVVILFINNPHIDNPTFSISKVSNGIIDFVADFYKSALIINVTEICKELLFYEKFNKKRRNL